MDTVTVDVQKLQTLNDRIAQMIDALNQVRLSTHGLQHSQPLAYAQPVLPQPALAQSAVPHVMYTQPLGTPWTAGLQHSAPLFNPFGQMPFQTGQQIPLGLGISHSIPLTDPYRQAQMAQGLPFATYVAAPMFAGYR